MVNVDEHSDRRNHRRDGWLRWRIQRATRLFIGSGFGHRSYLVYVHGRKVANRQVPMQENAADQIRYNVDADRDCKEDWAINQ
jgi:hypothetical protein